MLSFQRQNVSVSSQALFCLELSTLLEEGEEKPGEWRGRERNQRASGEGRVGVGRETAGRPTGEPDLTLRAKGHWQATHNYSTKLKWIIEYSAHSRITHTARRANDIQSIVAWRCFVNEKWYMVNLKGQYTHKIIILSSVLSPSCSFKPVSTFCSRMLTHIFCIQWK